MRHIRARRRFKSILISVLVFSAILFLEAKVESFAPQLKVFTESRIEEIFDNNIKLSIGKLDGGILHPLAVNDCSLVSRDGAALFPSLAIDSIRSNYRLWDVLLKRNSPFIDVKFALNGRDIIGFARIETGAETVWVKGYLDIFGTDRVDVIGQVKNRSFEAEFKSGYGSIKAKGTLSQDNELAANLVIDHLRIKGFDIAGDATLKNRLTAGPSGEIETRNLTVNYRPFLDIRASYEIMDDVLKIISLEVGGSLKARGKVQLDYPYNIDAVITTDNLNIGQILTDMNIDKESIILSGMMNGKFDLKGQLENPRLDARIEIRQGQIGTLDFDFLNARLRGDGPLLKIEDSRIVRSSGWFVLAGDINLSKTGMGNIFGNVKMASSDTAILWDGLYTKRKMLDMQEVRMEKRMNEDVKLGFKSHLSDTKVDEGLKDPDEVELKYKLHSHDSLKVTFAQDKDFFGWEHEDKF